MEMNAADLRPLQQLPLVQSITEDEDDDSPRKYDEHKGVAKHVSSENYHPHENMNYDHHYSADPHAALVDQVRSNNNNNNNNNREALAYLLRYETMVRQQEAEDMATIDHMRPCVERLQALAGMNSMNINSMNGTAHTENVLTQEISYGQLKTALERLEQSQLEQQQVDASEKACEFMTTDRQLMMVLRLLTKSVPATTTTSDTDTDSASSSTSSEEDQDNNNNNNNSHLTITWAEFLQCYKTCIVGMLTLQHLPASANRQVRARTRDRTLSMLSLFQPPTTFAGAGAASSSNNSNDIFAQAFDVRRPGVESLGPAPSALSRSPFSKNLKTKKQRRVIIAAAALIGIIVIMAPTSIPYSGDGMDSSSSPFEVDPIVVTNNGVEILSEGPSVSILQTVSSFTSKNGNEESMLTQQQPKQQSMPSTFFSRTPLFMEKRAPVPVRQAVASPTTAAPLTPPQEFMPLSTPHPTTEGMVSVGPAMIGGVVGCLGAPLLVAGLQGILKQAAVTATAIGGSVSAASTGTGLLVPVLAGVGAVLAMTSVARGIWTVLHSLVGGRH